MKNSNNRIKYVDSECLQVTFSYIIIRVKSINENFGQLFKFADENDLYGTTNGKLYILEEMVEPHQRLISLVTNLLKPLNLYENEDYVLGYEQLVHGARGSITPYLNKDIPALDEINWLGSIIKRKGNFVWNREVDNWEMYSDWRQKVHPQFILDYYQMLLKKYFETYHPDKLVFEPKVIELRSENVVFGLKKHYGVLHLGKDKLKALD